MYLPEAVCPLCKVKGRISDTKARMVCEACGAVWNETANVGKPSSWTRRCDVCGKKGGEKFKLVGLFVPHLCVECERKHHEYERMTGDICSLCHQTRSRCCC